MPSRSATRSLMRRSPSWIEGTSEQRCCSGSRAGTIVIGLTRARKDLKLETLKRLGPGDEVVEMKVSADARKKEPSLPRTWVARRIRYQIPGFSEQSLLTSLRDPDRFPADEIVALYHER